MNSKKKIVFLVLVVLCTFPTVVFADMIWPALYIAEGALCWYVILVGFLIEGIVIKLIFKIKFTKNFFLLFVANIISVSLAMIPIRIGQTSY